MQTKLAIAAALAAILVLGFLLFSKDGLRVLTDVSANRSESPSNSLLSQSGKSDESPEEVALRNELVLEPHWATDLFKDGSDPQPVDRVDVDLSDVNWRPMFDHTDFVAYPPDYDLLVSRFDGGDPNAAFMLARVIQICEVSGPPPMTGDQFEEELRSISVDHQVPQYRNGVRTTVDIAEYGDSGERAEEIARELFQACNRIPLEHRGEAGDWRRKSAESGSEKAMYVIASESLRAGDPSAMQEVWRAGDSSALQSIAIYHQRRFQSNADPDGNIKAFAHWLAVRELQYESSRNAGPNMKPFMHNTEIVMLQRSKSLLPWQVEEAKRLAADILKNRTSDCCISLDVPVR